MKLMIAVLFFVAASAPAEAMLPVKIRDAFNRAQFIAGRSGVRNLFMFNYVYYAGGYCKDQDCSAQKIQAEMASARAKLGDDFSKYQRYEAEYARAISSLQRQLADGSLESLLGARTYRQIQQLGIFTTCVDFAKSVLGNAIEAGFPEQDLAMFVTMEKESYVKMCPAPDGRKPILPRPVIHTLVAYKRANQWYALNVEDPQAIRIDLGPSLPARLGREFQFTFPALVAYRKLSYAGAYSAKDFIFGFPHSGWIGISAEGKPSPELDSIRCK